MSAKAKQFRLMDKPRPTVELVDLWRAGFDWPKGVDSQIVTVTYYPSGCATSVKVKAIRCPDGTTALRCPICGLECYDLGETKRGLGCGQCIKWLKPKESA